ncbi:MAG: C4-dicarboxylate ABC transporter, partial [Notoacmeibacter sp.]|nr:C4-dicarboxylate ABC transporter [Notoacmeibacter sp.]
MKKLLGAVSALAITLAAGSAMADENGCDAGEMVIKFSHVVAATGHPKGDAATALAARVNKEMDGKACMEV